MYICFIREIDMENKIKYLRVLCDLTQDDLAKQVGCTRQTINAIEKNKYSPSLVLAFRIAEVLKTDLTEVFSYQPSVDHSIK